MMTHLAGSDGRAARQSRKSTARTELLRATSRCFPRFKPEDIAQVDNIRVFRPCKVAFMAPIRAAGRFSDNLISKILSSLSSWHNGSPNGKDQQALMRSCTVDKLKFCPETQESVVWAEATGDQSPHKRLDLIKRAGRRGAAAGPGGRRKVLDGTVATNPAKRRGLSGFRRRFCNKA